MQIHDQVFTLQDVSLSKPSNNSKEISLPLGRLPPSLGWPAVDCCEKTAQAYARISIY